FGDIPIRVPVGSRLISVDTVVLDTAGATPYSVDLIKTTIAAGAAVVHLGTLTGGGTTGMVHHLITPAATEIAAPGVAYVLRVGDFFLSNNDFCQVTVTYDTKP
ncbi:MAG: hypothetical protein ABIZ69_05395, partial [Ilumatobacteraceae bacterium]